MKWFHSETATFCHETYSTNKFLAFTYWITLLVLFVYFFSGLNKMVSHIVICWWITLLNILHLMFRSRNLDIWLVGFVLIPCDLLFHIQLNSRKPLTIYFVENALYVHLQDIQYLILMRELNHWLHHKYQL